MQRRLTVLIAVVVTALVFLPPASAAFISGYRAKQFVREIAALGPRTAGSLNEIRVAKRVRAKFEAWGYNVEIQTFTLPNGDVSRNVVGRTTGTFRAIVVAHMDGVHHTQAANDNGSGVGGMLEIARVLAAQPGVLVAALGAEERMVTGSRYHLGSFRLVHSLTVAEKQSVRFAMSLDMIGVGPTLNIRGLETTPNRSARIALARARALGYKATYLRDTGQSDHDDLTRAGVPAAWIEWRWDPCWHQPCDRWPRLDPVKLRRAARVVLAGARSVLPT
jgi:hypothetical protein